jgi:hypothetical protein
MEMDYEKILSEQSRKYNFFFKSFMSDSDLKSDHLFYDPQHLCVEGAQIFSEKIADILNGFKEMN